MHTHLHKKEVNTDRSARREVGQRKALAVQMQDNRPATIAQRALLAAIQKKNDGVKPTAQHADNGQMHEVPVQLEAPNQALQGKFETIQRGEKAKIVTDVSNTTPHLAGWDLGHVNQAGNVEFKLIQVELNKKNYSVGGEMTAHALGPHHPQGGPPGSTELGDIMSVLPTEPKNTAEQKYIKGHLLNDNLGGPGTQPNLFPITAAANKQHENQVESHVKHWVNEKGYWVYYRVKVENITKEAQKSGWEALNATFVCEAAPLSKNGKKISKLAFKKTIVSTLGKVEDFIPAFLYLPENPETDLNENATVAAGFDKEKVEWSTTKGNASLPQSVDDEITMKSEVIMKILSSYIGEKEKAIQFISGQLNNVGVVQNLDILTRMILDPYFEIDHTHLALRNSSDIAVWNNMVNLINQNKAKILEWLGNIESVLQEQKNKELLEKTQKENQRRLEREVNKLLNGYRPKKFEREKKIKGVKKMSTKNKKAKNNIKVKNNIKAKNNIITSKTPKVIKKTH